MSAPLLAQVRDGGLAGDKDKLAVLTSADNTLKSLAATASDYQVAIDIALLAQVRNLGEQRCGRGWGWGG